MEKATKKQLWALYCLTKKDYRDQNLTKDEANVLIQKAIEKHYGVSVETTKKTLLEAIEKAYEVERQFYEKEPDTVIYESDLSGTPLSKGKKYYVEKFSGCGIAYLLVESKFIKMVKKISNLKTTRLKNITAKVGKHTLSFSKHYNLSGYYICVVDNKSYSNGNINCLVAFYDTIANALSKIGFKVTVFSNLDWQNSNEYVLI